MESRICSFGKNIGSEDSWLRLKDGKMKKEAEGLPADAQDQPLRTNVIKKRIDKNKEDSKCKMCKVES